MRRFVLQLDTGHRGYVAGMDSAASFYIGDLAKARRFTEDEAKAWALPGEVLVEVAAKEPTS